MSERLFKSVDACQDMVVEALKYHLLPDRRQLMYSRRTQPRKSYIGLLFAFGANDSGKHTTRQIIPQSVCNFFSALDDHSRRWFCPSVPCMSRVIITRQFERRADPEYLLPLLVRYSVIAEAADHLGRSFGPYTCRSFYL